MINIHGFVNNTSVVVVRIKTLLSTPHATTAQNYSYLIAYITINIYTSCQFPDKNSQLLCANIRKKNVFMKIGQLHRTYVNHISLPKFGRLDMM